MNSNRRIHIETLADRIRDECGLSAYGFENIFDAVERHGCRLIRYPTRGGSFLGAALIKDSDRLIVSNSSLILSREIFTVAHELGHHTLHLSEHGVRMIKDDDLCENSEREVEANHFAACLLMPEDKIEKFVRQVLRDKPMERWTAFDVARMQTAFNVSYQTVLVRLRSTGKMPYRISERLSEEKHRRTALRLLSAIGGNVNLCRPSGVKRVPGEFFEWVISNYRQRLIPLASVQTAFAYVDQSLDEVGWMNEEENTVDETNPDDTDFR